MGEVWLFSSLVLLLVSLVTLKLGLPSKRYRNLPPHPISLPIIGHLHLLKFPLHRTLQKLSVKYGPIFSLSFGSRLVVIVTSPSVAEECFTTNDIVLANRPITLAVKLTGYNDKNLPFAPYGDYWRKMRKLATEEIFSPTRLKNFESTRQDEIAQLLKSLFRSSQQSGSAKVELKSKFSGLSLNLILRMITGKRYFDDEINNEEGKKVGKLIKEMFEQAESTNPEDLLPFLQWLDFRGLKKSLARLGEELDVFLQGLIDEHRKETRNTMISHLLSLQESDPQYYTDLTIKAFVVGLISAGTDTSSTTIEWVMAVLLNNPYILEKARSEVDSRVGHDRLVDETDLPNLPYLQNIILETYRLYPAAPFLLPHFSSKDCKIQGYDIPRGTMLLVNAWAIYRDPLSWDNATTFNPERYEGKTVDPFTLMPFGRGRRQCPASSLANKVVGLTIASLIQCFDWSTVNGEKIKLEEGKGLTMPLAKPLEAICKPRNFVNKILAS